MSDLECLRVNSKEIDALAAEWAQVHRIWVPSEKEGYVLATVVKDADSSGFAEVHITETGEKQRVSLDDIHKVNPLKYHKCDDMATMTCLNEPAVLYNLKQRYSSDLIYTYSGLFCVVINPYKQLKIYKDNIADCFKGRKRSDVPPHIFAVADEAYRRMLQNRENQSILCTGESGAGKTENTKKVIQYLAHVAGSRKTRYDRSDLDTSSTSGRSLVGHLEDQLLQANPILESFGNSKTVKNDNSSRFGKFVRIHFDSAGYICGANIEFYLLEKSRVLRQAPNERSFHIFYQLIRGASKRMREELLLENSPSKYRFLTNGDLGIPGVNDAQHFQETKDSMRVMGISDDEMKAVFRIISALLLFGNLEFAPEGTNSDQARITNDAVLQKIAKLLSVNFDDLQRAILKPRMKLNRDHVHRSQNVEQARFSVEAIAKATYERLFRWLVKRLNRSLDRTRQNAANFVGILDIAGFEIFEKNSFEQLCINYTNEKLQQLFNSTMFVREQQEYISEGIEWSMIDYGLNLQPTIDLIEKPMGVLAILDDVCLFPGGNDASLVQRLITQHQNHPKFITPEMRSKSDFGLIHYAGRVDYRAAEWRVKNMDPLNENVIEILQISRDSLVAEIWKDTSDICKMSTTEPNENLFGSRAKRGLFRTVSQLYKEQLATLMTTLSNTNPHFVRCIIPNHEKKPGTFNGPMVLEQLRCNGVLEGIRIARQGFPNRIPFQEFRQRYGRLLAPQAVPQHFMDGKEAVKRIVEALEINPQLYRIGQSKIFFRHGCVATLEHQRDAKLAEFVILFQASARGTLARKRFQKMREQSNAICIIQRNGRSWMRQRNWEWWKLYTKVLPIVTADIEKERFEDMEAELKNVMEKLRRTEDLCTDLQTRIEMIAEERDNIQQRYDVESLEHTESTEELNRVITAKKELEKQFEELGRQLTVEENHRRKSEDERLKLSQKLLEMENRLVHEDECHQRIISEKRIVEQKLKELEELKLGADESSSRVIKEKQEMEAKYSDASDRLLDATDRNQELSATIQRLNKEVANLKSQLSEANAKYHTDVAEKVEELRKKHNREMQEATARYEDEAASRSKAEKAKQKAQQEYDDLSREVNNLTMQNKEYDRKQRRFDQNLADEKRRADDIQESVYAAEQTIRDLESRLLSSQNEVTSLKNTIGEMESERRDLRFKIGSLTSNQDGAGKNVYELESAKRRLEDELNDAKIQIEELESELDLEKNKRSRAEVQFQAQKNILERQLRERDLDDDGQRQFKQRLRSMEEQIEEAQRLHHLAASTRDKIERENRALQEGLDLVLSENSIFKDKITRLERKYKEASELADSWELNCSIEKENTERINKLYHKTKIDLQTTDDELAAEIQKSREARRQSLNLEEKIDTLTRELQQYQIRQRRVSLAPSVLGRSVYGSSTSINRIDETLGSENSPCTPSRQLEDEDAESVLSPIL